MKATGIVRRIDDLGRVVIPKEIRRTLRIREGDPLEIFTDKEGEVIFKKYSPMADLGEFAQGYADSLFEATNHVVLIVDQDEVIAVSGASRKSFVGRRVTEHVEQVMNTRKTYLSNIANENMPVEGVEFSAQVISPIIVTGDLAGSVILLATDGEGMSNTELKLAETASNFLAKQLGQ